MPPALKESQKPPRKVGIYRLEEEIGSGAMGKVYRATHETLGKEVALKLLHVDENDSEVQKRFVQEGIAASRVRHPNVVDIFDAGTEGDTTYLAMQLLEGETLAECLARQGRLPLTYAIDLILPVCAALIAAHEAGVLHRDLKPANIFLSDVGRGDPEPVLVDFGISKILGPVDAELTQNPRFLGTPFYIAPEQADGQTATPLSDQYSLALTLYETLLGVRPFEKFRSSLIKLLRHVAEGDIRRPHDLDASISIDLDETICRALSPDPKERFPSIREFGAALLPYASEARRTLWQHSFINAERTMTSVNAPVSDSRASRKVRVSVAEAAPVTPGVHEEETAVGAPDSEEEFLSHSLLFGGKSKEADDENTGIESFNPEKSTVSRRVLELTDEAEATDPYSQMPSNRHTGRWDSSRKEASTQPDPSVGGLFSSQSGARLAPPPRRQAIIFAAAALALGVTFGLGSWGLLADSDPKVSSSYSVQVEVIPSSAKLSVDDLFVGNGHFKRKFKKDGVAHRLVARAPSYEATTIIFTDQAPPRLITLKTLESAEESPQSSPSQSQVPSDSAVTEPSPAEKSLEDESLQKKAPGRTRPRLLLKNTASAPSSPTHKEAAAAPVVPAPVVEQDVTPNEKPASIPTGNLDPWAK